MADPLRYLWAHLAPAARQAGSSDAELRRIAQGPDTPGWDPFEATVIRAADDLHIDSFISDATWRTLSARYDVRQLIDQGSGIGDRGSGIRDLGVRRDLGPIVRQLCWN